MADYHLSHTGAELDLAISRVINNYKDTSDATAQASNIQSGFTAYARGSKVTGTHVCASMPSLQTKSVYPTDSSQTVLPDTGYGGLSRVNVSAIPSDHVGSGITRRSSTDLTASGATVTAPAGYYASSASKSVASGTQGTPTATKGTVTNHAVTVTPRCTDTTGYITGTTKTGTAVTVSASELVSGTRTISTNGEVDVTNYQKVNVNVSGDAPRLQSKTATPSASSLTVSPDSGYDGLSSVTINGDSDLVASNIKSGVNIFGVTGTYTGGGSGVTVEPLSVTANGTYTAPSGKAYSPVTVNVSGGGAPTVLEGTVNAPSRLSRLTITGLPTTTFHMALIQISGVSGFSLADSDILSCYAVTNATTGKCLYYSATGSKAYTADCTVTVNAQYGTLAFGSTGRYFPAGSTYRYVILY